MRDLHFSKSAKGRPNWQPLILLWFGAPSDVVPIFR